MNKRDTEQFAKLTIQIYEKIRRSKLNAWTSWSSDETFWIVFPNKVMYEDFLLFIDEPHEEINEIGEKYKDIGTIRIIWEEH